MDLSLLDADIMAPVWLVIFAATVIAVFIANERRHK